MNLILASGSPRRKELLSLYTTDFTICVIDFDENGVTAPTPAQLVEKLARQGRGASHITTDWQALPGILSQEALLLSATPVKKKSFAPVSPTISRLSDMSLSFIIASTMLKDLLP